MSELVKPGQGRSATDVTFSGMVACAALTGIGTVVFALVLVRLAFWIAG